jgi:hypothetical protein
MVIDAIILLSVFVAGHIAALDFYQTAARFD